jgi:hypothetical protein
MVMARSRFNDPIEPMTLSNMRENGLQLSIGERRMDEQAFNTSVRKFLKEARRDGAARDRDGRA